MIGLFIIPRRNLLRSIGKALHQPDYAIKAFSKRFMSYMTYLLGMGYSAPPETISLFLTRRCNLRCPMCGQWGEKGSFKDLGEDVIKDELDAEEIRLLIDDINGFKPNITLFGGEPMLYPSWMDVVGYVKSHGMRCNMVTNGVLLDQYIDRIIKVGLDEIVFSLDGPEEVHDRMRGRKGTFKRAIKGFKGLQALKKERSLKKPIVSINSTIFEYNYDSIDEVRDVAEDIGADSITFHHLLFLSKEMCDRHNAIFEPRFGNRCMDWYGFVRDELPDIDVDELISKKRWVEEKKGGVKVFFYPNFTDDEIRRYYTDWEFLSDSYPNRCMSLWMAAYIFPDGSVRPYHSMEFIPGNIRETRFNEIWNNRRYREYRRTIRKIKRFPVCPKGCTEFYRY